MTANEVKRFLGLEPHPCEGGWFRRTHESGVVLQAAAFPAAAYDGPRRLHSAIYYLLEAGDFSEMHRLGSDEMFHHYAGAAVEMLQLWPDGRVERVVIGKALEAGERPQVLVPGGVWQGSRLLPAEGRDGAWALLGCTVSPGFEYRDYQTGVRAELEARYPEAGTLIRALTRDVAD